MSVHETVKLVGTCVGLILGAILFFVLFFRGMAWIDLWVKYKTGFERSRPKVKPKRGGAGAVNSNPRRTEATLDATQKSQLLLDPAARSDRPKGVIREQLANRKNRSSVRCMDDRTTDDDSAVDLQVAELSRKTLGGAEVGEPEMKTPNRIATVQLLTGESIERVSFCSKEKANTICEGLGFIGIALEKEDGQICVVRESNIKLVTWKAC